ncbi:MAG: hypothetical protein OXB93_01440 [Cytophagales bacterium]|nr:hypothetical protein [Cytophagales bacterium]
MAWRIHPLHVGICEIHVDPSGSLELAQKVFADDMTFALSSFWDMELDIEEVLSAPDGGRKYLDPYYSKHLSLWMGQEKLKLESVLHEMDLERGVVWSSFRASWTGDLTKLQVENKLLMEIFSDQTHMVYVQCHRKTYTLRTDISSSRMSLRLAP